MAMNSSGPISIGGSTAGQSINIELGRSATASSTMNESALRTLAGVASGAISFSNFYGKSNDITTNYALYASATNLSANLCKKFNYTTFAITTTTSLNNGVTGRQGTGNYSLGLITGGGPLFGEVFTTEKFIFSNNTVIAGGNLDIQRKSGTGFSNSSQGILACGQVGSQISGNSATGEVCSKYTWSNDTCVSTSTLGFGSANLSYTCSGSNSLVGVIRDASGVTKKYTFSTNAITSGSAVNGGANGGQATSTSVNGYFRPYNDYNIHKYNFSTDAVTAVSTGSDTCTNAVAAGNSSIGHFDNGTSGISSLVYTYSSDTYVGSGSYSLGMNRPVPISNPPGGF